MDNEAFDFIDLTNSFTLVDHKELRNQVINVDSDDSVLELSSDDLSSKKNKPQTSKIRVKCKFQVQIKKSSIKALNAQKACSNKIGECPICWDELGKNPLASTKCGHVFCVKCLEKTLAFNKKCPTCRCSLTGKAAYHPLYLNYNNLSNK